MTKPPYNIAHKDVMIGFPCYDNRADVDVFQPLLEGLQDPDSSILRIQYFNGDSLIPRARNKIAQLFLDDDKAQYLMFVDSDIKISHHDIDRLRKHNKGIVGGLYLKKKLPYSPVVNHHIGNEGELMIMNEIGTGLMMIRKDVFAAIAARWPEHRYHYEDDEQGGSSKWSYDWFRTGVYGERYLSEDYFFCRLAGELGYKCYLDKSVLGQHIGKMRFPMEDKMLLQGAAALMENYNPAVKPPVEEITRIRDAANNLIETANEEMPKPKPVELSK